MPHISIAYSANLDSVIDIGDFCDHLRRTAIGLDVFPAAGVRVRAWAARHYSIADGNPAHGFVDISVRLRGGRSLAARKRATAALFAAAEAYLAPVMAARPLALSMEMRDIDPDLSPKTGTIRDHLKSV